MKLFHSTAELQTRAHAEYSSEVRGCSFLIANKTFKKSPGFSESIQDIPILSSTITVKALHHAIQVSCIFQIQIVGQFPKYWSHESSNHRGQKNLTKHRKANPQKYNPDHQCEWLQKCDLISPTKPLRPRPNLSYSVKNI